MPTVPGAQLSAPSLPKIPNEYLLMAAATMHEQGRLVDPNQAPPFLKELKAGDWGNPAQLYQGYLKDGQSPEEARKNVIKSLGAKTGSHEGMEEEDIEADTSNNVGS